MKKFLLPLFLLPFITGCLQSPEESRTSLINNPGGKFEFQVNKNYQEVHRIIKNHIGRAGDFDRAADDLYTDIKQGTVIFEGNGFFGATTFFYVNVKAIDEQSTNVVIYYKYNTWRERAKEIMEYVRSPHLLQN